MLRSRPDCSRLFLKLASALALLLLASPVAAQGEDPMPPGPPGDSIDPRCVAAFGDDVTRSESETFLCTSGLCTRLTCYTTTEICVGESCTSFEVPHEIIIEGDGIETNQTCTADDPDHIFQCPFDEFGLEPELLPDTLPNDFTSAHFGENIQIFPALYALEDEEIDALLADHDLPSSDRERVLGWARNEVRARLFNRVVKIANTSFSERTDAETNAVLAVAYATKVKRVQAVQLAINEYYKWAQNPCTYVAPEGFAYTPNAGVCDGGTLIVLFDNVSPPSEEEFLAYGLSLASERLRQPDAAAIHTETGLATKTLASVGIAVTGTSVVAATVLAAAAAIFPHALEGAGLAYASAAGLVASGAVAGFFLILLVLIFTGVMQGIFVFTDTQVPDRLNEALAQAQNTPAEIVGLRVPTPAGLSEIYDVFIETTLPDFTDPGPPPAPAVGDPIFRVTDEFGMNPVYATHIHPRDWADEGYDVRLKDGWFVVGAMYDGNPVNFMSLGIKHKDCSGNQWYASRVGTNFVFTNEALDGFEDAEQESELHYLDGDGVCRIATVFIDDTPPEITPSISGTEGDNGWYVSDVDLSWEVSDDETAVASMTGCDPETFDTDGTYDRTCEATSGGGTSSESVQIKRDATPPSISHTVSPSPNANGWYKAPPTITFTCSDATSGIIYCTDAPTLPEGADQSLTGTAEDAAGNTTDDTVSGIDIDQTPPVVTLTTPGDGASFVLMQAVPADWSASDALSGLASAVGTVDFGQPIDTSTAGMKSFVVTAVDLAGNETEVMHTYDVLSTEDAIGDLIAEIEGLGLEKQGKSLVSKLEGALKDLGKGKTNGVLGKLRAFIHEVEAQRGKKLTDEQADLLVAQAALIIGSL